MRYAYVKNGDALAQVARFMDGAGGESGPDAFIGDFLRRHPTEEVLVLCRGDRSAGIGNGRLRAQAVASPRWVPGQGLRRVWASIGIGLEILRWRPDRLLVGCSGEMLWCPYLAGRIIGAEIVVSRHGGLPNEGLPGRLKLFVERAVLRSVRAVICHGPFLADGIRDLGVPVDRIREFEVDLSRFASRRGPEELPQSLEELRQRRPFLLMYVGRIQASKGPLDLLEAFRRLPAELAERAGLVFVGDGADIEVLRARVAACQPGSVLVLGKVPHDSLPCIMSSASIIAAPTQPQLPEGRCMVVLEAMSLGVPVIAPRFAAFPYAIAHEVNGLMYEPGSVDALSDAIARVIRDPEFRGRLAVAARDSGALLAGSGQSFGAAVEAAFT